MDTTVLILVIVVVVLVVAVAALLIPRLREQKRSSELQRRFGPEYDRTVSSAGDRRAAEQELERRAERREQFDIRDLEPGERQRYAQAWRETQKRFVDSPGEAIGEADELVGRVMRDRGYPVDDFEQRADDLSVDHPGVVEDYRAANRIAVAHRRGEATTEDLRRALVHYRSLFDRLLGDDSVDGRRDLHSKEVQ